MQFHWKTIGNLAKALAGLLLPVRAAVPAKEENMELAQDDYVLAVLSTAEGAEWTPVQVQKIFFLLDKKIAGRVGGPHFDFAAYDYGPFDAGVYSAIERQEASGKTVVQQANPSRMKTFRLTPGGQQTGQQALAALPEEARDYVRRLSQWVRSLSFQQLVSAVYKEFPEMRANSIFQG